MTKIFFDVDGVLIHGFHVKPELRRLWSENLSRDLGILQEDFEKHVVCSSNWTDVVEGRKSLENLLEEVLPYLNFKGSVQDIINYWVSNDSKIDKKLMELLYAIKQKNEKIEFYIATNQEHNRADYLWNNLRFKDIFEDIFYSAKMGMVKSNPEFFYSVNKQLGLKDENNILFFDDSIKNVESAKLANWNAFEYETIKDFVENPLIKELLNT
ncbi:HAD family hydrolase [Pseudomonadota bacterium]